MPAWKKVILIMAGVSLLGFAFYACASAKGKASEAAGSTTRLPRAFEGAPPLVPHEIGDEHSCLVCHRLGENSAPITPHPERTNCVQCHIPQMPGVKPFVENTFRAGDAGAPN
jgi:nitrate reductase cytochrome c-type subunit